MERSTLLSRKTLLTLFSPRERQQALSDPEARRNWEKYGHPDGYQPWTFDLALPGWLRPGKDTSDGTLILYGVGYLVGTINL